MKPDLSPRPLLAGLALMALAACTETIQSAPSLSLACQTKDCACVAEQQSIFDKGKSVPLLWKQNGDAYCPDGHVLQLVTDEK